VREGRARLIVADRIGTMPVTRLQVTDVDQWIVRMRKAKVGEGSIRNQLQTLRSAMAQAVRWGWISQNPTVLASYERQERTVRDVMSAEDIHAVLAAAVIVNEMAPVAFRLAAITGDHRRSPGRAGGPAADRPRRSGADHRQRHHRRARG